MELSSTNEKRIIIYAPRWEKSITGFFFFFFFLLMLIFAMKWPLELNNNPFV